MMKLLKEDGPVYLRKLQSYTLEPGVSPLRAILRPSDTLPRYIDSVSTWSFVDEAEEYFDRWLYQQMRHELNRAIDESFSARQIKGLINESL